MTEDSTSRGSSGGYDKTARSGPSDSDPLKAALYRGLLDLVVRQTEADSSQLSGRDRSDIEALASVARKFSGQPLTLEPALVELVETILLRQFAPVATNADWHLLSREVARTLFEDPKSQPRLHRLWTHLLQFEP